jgi:MFS family permease
MVPANNYNGRVWQMRSLRAVALIVLPFAAAYFVSYFFRTINAVISETLARDLKLDASQLGLLTSVYFLTFASMQIPVGILLDRYGPKRVQSVLLLFSAAGAALFGFAHNFEILLTGRALIGFGVAASLTAGLKAITIWFPKDPGCVKTRSVCLWAA